MTNYNVATASDYQTLLKERNKNAEGVSEWENLFLKPLQKSVEAQNRQISEQANYDISSAYANFKKNQLNLMQSQQLGTGFKQELGSEMKNAYDTSFFGVKAKEASDIQNTYQSYFKTLAEEDERLLDKGSQLAALEESLYAFGGITDLDDMYSDEKYGYYSNDASGNVVLTDKGREFFDELLHGTTRVGKNSFEQYLAENDNEELLDFYRKNKGVVNELVGGLSPTDMSYSESERLYDIQADENMSKTDELLKTIKDDKFKETYYDKEASFDTPEERKKYYEEKYKTLEEVVKNDKKHIYDGKVYEEQDVYTPNSQLNVEISSALKIPEKLRSGELTYGDVIEHNGRLFVIKGKVAGPGTHPIYAALNTSKEAEDIMKSRGYKKSYDYYTKKTTWSK